MLEPALPPGPPPEPAPPLDLAAIAQAMPSSDANLSPREDPPSCGVWLADPAAADVIAQALKNLQPLAAIQPAGSLRFAWYGTHSPSRQKYPLTFTVDDNGRCRCNQSHLPASVRALAAAISKAWADQVAQLQRIILTRGPRSGAFNNPFIHVPVKFAAEQILLQELAAGRQGAPARDCALPPAPDADPQANRWSFDPAPLAQRLFRLCCPQPLRPILGFTPSLAMYGPHHNSYQLAKKASETDPAAAAWWLHRQLERSKPQDAHFAHPQDVDHLITQAQADFKRLLTRPEDPINNSAADWNYYSRLDPALLPAVKHPLDVRRLRLALKGRQPQTPELAKLLLKQLHPIRAAQHPEPFASADWRLYQHDHRPTRERPEPFSPGLSPWLRWLDRQAAQLPASPATARRQLLQPLQILLAKPPTNSDFYPGYRVLQAQAQDILDQNRKPAAADQALRRLYGIDPDRPRSQREVEAQAQKAAHSTWLQLDDSVRAALKDAAAELADHAALRQQMTIWHQEEPNGARTAWLTTRADQGNPTASHAIAVTRHADGALWAFLYRPASPRESVKPRRPTAFNATLDRRHPVRYLLGAEDLAMALVNSLMQAKPSLKGPWSPTLIALALHSNLSPYEGVVKGIAQEVIEPRYLQLVTDQADPETLALLEASGREPTSRAYNHLQQAKSAYAQLFPTNPAVAVAHLALTEGSAYDPDPMPPIKHPGQAVAAVKDRFRQAGARHWKAFARRPAAFMKDWLPSAIYDPHYPERGIAASFHYSDILHDAGFTPDTGPATRTIATGIQQLIGMDQRHKSQPSYRKAAFLLAKAGANLDPKDETAAQQLYGQVWTVRDCLDNRLPDLPLNAASWPGLVRHAQEWHRRINEVRVTAATREALRRQNGEIKAWNSYIEEWQCPLDLGWTATALSNEILLYAESDRMNNCAGQRSYIDMCVKGESRLFHLEHPELLPQGATLELRHNARDPKQMSLAQLAGPHNTIPPESAQAAADRLAADYRNAAQADARARHRSHHFAPTPEAAAAIIAQAMPPPPPP